MNEMVFIPSRLTRFSRVQLLMAIRWSEQPGIELQILSFDTFASIALLGDGNALQAYGAAFDIVYGDCEYTIDTVEAGQDVIHHAADTQHLLPLFSMTKHNTATTYSTTEQAYEVPVTERRGWWKWREKVSQASRSVSHSRISKPICLIFELNLVASEQRLKAAYPFIPTYCSPVKARQLQSTANKRDELIRAIPIMRELIANGRVISCSTQLVDHETGKTLLLYLGNQYRDEREQYENNEGLGDKTLPFLKAKPVDQASAHKYLVKAVKLARDKGHSIVQDGFEEGVIEAYNKAVHVMVFVNPPQPDQTDMRHGVNTTNNKADCTKVYSETPGIGCEPGGVWHFIEGQEAMGHHNQGLYLAKDMCHTSTATTGVATFFKATETLELYVELVIKIAFPHEYEGMKKVKPLVMQHEDDPKALWEALDVIFAPRKAGARFNAYRTLTSIQLREEESLLSLTGRVSAAMRLLKGSRPAEFTLENTDEELQAVVLLMALPDDGQFAVLKAPPFEQSPTSLKVSVIEQAYANHQAFRTAHQEGDQGQSNPLSGIAMAAASAPPPPPVSSTPPSSSAALAAAPPAQAAPLMCYGCGESGHTLLYCFKFQKMYGLEPVGNNNKKKKGKKGGAAATSEIQDAHRT
ncbi:hypothetical protein FB451DRAFT_1425688 [Mycena latifolia]|nr:hypothetical protein FB451DRAFT_1425688 [Mycena latifolia]